MTDPIENKTHSLLTKKGGLTPAVQSPSSELVKLQLQHDIHVDDEEREFQHENVWKSCCIRSDKRAILFFSQVLTGVGIITFCVAMLVTNTDCATFSRYSPLLTLVVGILLPNPRLNRD